MCKMTEACAKPYEHMEAQRNASVTHCATYTHSTEHFEKKR